MVENQIECFKLKQRSVIKLLVAEKGKQFEIYRRMCGVYEKESFSKKKIVYKWTKNGLVASSLSRSLRGFFDKKAPDTTIMTDMLTVFCDLKE